MYIYVSSLPFQNTFQLNAENEIERIMQVGRDLGNDYGLYDTKITTKFHEEISKEKGYWESYRE